MTEPGFDEWVEPYAAEIGQSDDDHRAAVMEWFREVFDEAGPVSRSELLDLARGHQLGLAEEGVRLVMRDAAATADLAAEVVVDTLHNSIRISYDGSYTTPSMLAFDRASAVAEVADYLQDHISQSLWRAWPVCSDHDLGLRARVRRGIPVWWCKSGEHSVAPIGALGTG